MDWISNIVTIAGPAGLVSALATHWLANWRDKRTDKKQATYLALRLAIVLENYAATCLNLASDIDTGAEIGADPSSLSTNIPTLPAFPEDVVGWRALEPDLAHRVMALPVDQLAYQGAVNEDWMYCGPNSAPFECARLCGTIGLAAWKCAVDLRKFYHLPEYLPVYRFDKSLELRVARDEENRRKAKVRNLELFSSNKGME